MRVTLDIDENKMNAILKATHQKKKSPALALALDEFLRTREREAFIAKVLNGETDYQASNDEIEASYGLERHYDD